MQPDEVLRPEWCVDARVGALMSTRRGGVSTAPYDSLNLGGATGDAAESVAENRRRFAAELGAPVRYLRQVHGATVLRLAAGEDGTLPPADAAITTDAGVACAVLARSW